MLALWTGALAVENEARPHKLDVALLFVVAHGAKMCSGESVDETDIRLLCGLLLPLLFGHGETTFVGAALWIVPARVCNGVKAAVVLAVDIPGGMDESSTSTRYPTAMPLSGGFGDALFQRCEDTGDPLSSVVRNGFVDDRC